MVIAEHVDVHTGPCLGHFGDAQSIAFTPVEHIIMS